MSTKAKTTVYCCVVDCKNIRLNSPGTEFYCFPTANPLYPHKLLRHKKWLTTVRRENEDGTPWLPNRKSRIYSRHFVGNKKSEDPRSPSFNPTIFPEVYRNVVVSPELSVGRYKRHIERTERTNVNDEHGNCSEQLTIEDLSAELENGNLSEENKDEMSSPVKVDQGVQVDLPFVESFGIQQLFICNPYMKDDLCDAETQAHCPDVKYIKSIANNLKTKDACCGSDIKHKDKKIGPDEVDDYRFKLTFQGVESIKTVQEMLDIAGVTQTTFQLLLKVLSKEKAKSGIKLSVKNRLLIFLTKMKTGLSFSALSVFFSVHRSTLSRTFYATLSYLAAACKNFVLWPEKEIVQATMPQAFKDSYKDCRGIIDCTEFKVEQPPSVELRVQFYSHYKKGFRLKVLVCCTPYGLISFISKCNGGRTTDAQITTNSGFLELLEPGDVILADKGFPQIKTVLDNSGRGILIVMPPFLHNNTFNAEEVADTYKIASVRIHIERIMQRLRIYKVLDLFTIKMLPYCDDIVFMCAVLVNLQPPIIRNSDSEDK